MGLLTGRTLRQRKGEQTCKHGPLIDCCDCRCLCFVDRRPANEAFHKEIHQLIICRNTFCHKGVSMSSPSPFHVQGRYFDGNVEIHLHHVRTRMSSPAFLRFAINIFATKSSFSSPTQHKCCNQPQDTPHVVARCATHPHV